MVSGDDSHLNVQAVGVWRKQGQCAQLVTGRWVARAILLYERLTMTLELIGRLILCAGIVAGMILFITVNINYQPNDEDETTKDPEGNNK